MLRRRHFLAALLALPGAAGCGFRPLHGTGTGAAVASELAAIRVVPRTNETDRRLGQILAMALVDRLRAGGAGRGSPRYRLEIELGRSRADLRVQTSSTVTRRNLVVRAKCRLYDAAGDALLYATTVRTTGSFDVVRSHYATMVAEEETARDAARDLADSIANLLALHFLGRDAEEGMASPAPR